MKIVSLAVLMLIVLSCNNNQSNPQGDWIKGSEEEKIKTIEKQFRGFDNAMIETGYRYQEIYWAGQDTNWGYANYQLEKIKLAIENGLQRRPKRAKSAKHFLTYVLPEMQKSVDSKDTAVFNKGFLLLTTNCNSCHATAEVPFFSVKIPTERQSPIKK